MLHMHTDTNIQAQTYMLKQQLNWVAGLMSQRST